MYSVTWTESGPLLFTTKDGSIPMRRNLLNDVNDFIAKVPVLMERCKIANN